MTIAPFARITERTLLSCEGSRSAGEIDSLTALVHPFETTTEQRMRRRITEAYAGGLFFIMASTKEESNEIRLSCQGLKEEPAKKMCTATVLKR